MSRLDDNGMLRNANRAVQAGSQTPVEGPRLVRQAQVGSDISGVRTVAYDWIPQKVRRVVNLSSEDENARELVISVAPILEQGEQHYPQIPPGGGSGPGGIPIDTDYELPSDVIFDAVAVASWGTGGAVWAIEFDMVPGNAVTLPTRSAEVDVWSFLSADPASGLAFEVGGAAAYGSAKRRARRTLNFPTWWVVWPVPAVDGSMIGTTDGTQLSDDPMAGSLPLHLANEMRDALEGAVI